MRGLINVDFRDVRTIRGETGGAVMGVGVGRGENRAIEAVKKACHSPLQEKIVIDGARGVLINITGGPDITMHEINEATSSVYEMADDDANIIFGVVIDERMKDEMRVTIIATGFSDAQEASQPIARVKAPKVFPREPQQPARPVTPPIADPVVTTGVPDTTTVEPDPIPAIARKQNREQTTGMPPIDFKGVDNPLNQLDDLKFTDSPFAGTSGSTSYSSGLGTEPRQPAPSFQDSQPIEDSGNPDEDPYDIPALERRRKQRFFE